MMPYNHLIFCCPLFLLPSIFPSTRVFSNESVLWIRWSKYWSFSFRISPSNEYSGLISFRMNWLDLPEVQGILKSLLQHHSSKALILRHSAFFIVVSNSCNPMDHRLPGSSVHGIFQARVLEWGASAQELMLLNCDVGEDSWESLGLQGDPTSPFWRRSALGFLWKEWC